VKAVREGFAARLRNDPGRYSLVIPMAAGALMSAPTFADEVPGRLAPPLALAFGMIVGAYGSALGAFLHASMLFLGGRVIGGRARAVDLRAAVGWGMFPMLPAGLVDLASRPLLGSVGLEMEPFLLPDSDAANVVDIAVTLTGLGCALLTLALTYTLVAEAQGFSVLRAVWSHVVGLFIVVTPLVLAALAYSWLA